MRCRWFRYAFLLLVGLSCQAQASSGCLTLPEAWQSKPLSLRELSDLTLSCHPQTRVAWAQTKASWAALGIDESVLYPQLTGLANYGNNYLRQDGSNTTQNNASIGLGLNYLLLDFGASALQAKSSEWGYRASQFTQNRVMQTLIEGVEQAYYTLIGQGELLKANQLSVKEAAENLKATQEKRAAGIATLGDEYQAKSALLQAELTLLQAEGDYHVFEGMLMNAIGLPLHLAPLRLASLPSKIEYRPILEKMDCLLQQASQSRPDLWAAQYQVNAQSAQLASVKRQRFPSIQLNMTTQQFRSGGNIGTVNSGSNSGNGFSNSLRLSLSFPLFTGYQKTYAIRQAEAQQALAEANYDNLRQDVHLSVWQAYYGVQTAVKSIESSLAFLTSANQARTQAVEQYRAGVGDILTVLNTQSTAETARAQVIQAKLNWHIAMSTFVAAMGKGVYEHHHP